MKLKKVLSICKANGLYYLYDRRAELSEAQ